MRQYLLKMGIFFIFFVFGCGSGNQNRSQTLVVREAVNTPELFQNKTGVNQSGNSCGNPLIDPRDGTEITIVTSFGDGMGDYAVPAGSYGVEKNELLRINCRTGEVMGVVRR